VFVDEVGQHRPQNLWPGQVIQQTNAAGHRTISASTKFDVFVDEADESSVSSVRAVVMTFPVALRLLQYSLFRKDGFHVGR
jgi:hypothetical protein